MNYIYIYNELFKEKINNIVQLSTIINSKNQCTKCKKIFDKIYKYENISIGESEIHQFNEHNFINYILYEKISNLQFSNDIITYLMFNTNGIHIIDGLYEEGSNKIYIENKKNIFTSKINRFSEHYGFIYFTNNKLEKIVVLNESRVDNSDPIIFMPKNSLEALKVDYIFHTHPKTPYIGSRIVNSILYEFPSLSDITHFIEHHNKGVLLGSLVLAPEGIYIIRKYLFNRDKIKIDYDIFLSDVEDTYIECYQESMIEYSSLKDIKKINNFYKVTDDLFHNKIANNLIYLKKINKVLERYDITIDFYNRIKLEKNWIFPDIYIPNIP
jgi:hypothetical protein